MERYEFTPMLGPTEHFPVGSVEWSQRISNQLQIATDTVSYDVEHHVARCLKQVLSVEAVGGLAWRQTVRDARCVDPSGHRPSLGSSRPDRQ
jgi:hypothetical protein